MTPIFHPSVSPRRQRGFTLFELLVVMVLVSLMAAFVVPQLAGTLPNLLLKASAKKVSTLLRYCRSQAISEQTVYVALFELGQGRLVVRPAASGLAITRLEDEASELESHGAVKIYQLPEEVTLAEVQMGGQRLDTDFFQIAFYPSGGSSGGRIVLTNIRGRRFGVDVNFITGGVKLAALET